MKTSSQSKIVFQIREEGEVEGELVGGSQKSKTRSGINLITLKDWMIVLLLYTLIWASQYFSLLKNWGPFISKFL